MARPRVRFGLFEFETATGELWLDGRRVRLQRQPSRLLELLIARPGDVVSREDIRQATALDLPAQAAIAEEIARAVTASIPRG